MSKVWAIYCHDSALETSWSAFLDHIELAYPLLSGCLTGARVSMRYNGTACLSLTIEESGCIIAARYAQSWPGWDKVGNWLSHPTDLICFGPDRAGLLQGMYDTIDWTGYVYRNHEKILKSRKYKAYSTSVFSLPCPLP